MKGEKKEGAVGGGLDLLGSYTVVMSAAAAQVDIRRAITCSTKRGEEEKLAC